MKNMYFKIVIVFVILFLQGVAFTAETPKSDVRLSPKSKRLNDTSKDRSQNAPLRNNVVSLQGDNRNLSREMDVLTSEVNWLRANALTINYFNKHYKAPQEPNMTGMVIAVSCVGGVLFLFLLFLMILLLIRTKKNTITKKDVENLLKDKFSDFKRDQDETFETSPLYKKLKDLVQNALSEQMKYEREELKKSLRPKSGDDTSKGETDISQVVQDLKKLVDGELKTLRSQADSVSQKSREADRKAAEADKKADAANRKAADAQKKIDELEADKTRAVNAATTDMKTLMQEKSMAETAELRKQNEERATEIYKLRGKIQNLTLDNADLEKQIKTAESNGYERGLKTEQEKIVNLVEEKTKLASALEQQQSESDKIAKEKRKLAEANERLNDTLTKQSDEISTITRQKEDSDRKVRELQEQISQAKKEIGESKNNQLKAEARASEATKQTEALQASVAELQEEKAQLNNSIANCRISIEKLTNEKVTAENALHIAEKKITDLQEVLYPSEYVSDQDFATLREHLDSWFAEKIPAAEIVKSALGLFSQRASLDDTARFMALRNISVGISQTMRARKQSPDEILKELVLWSKFLMKFSDDNCFFSLKIPKIGDPVDTSWMKKSKSMVVNNVLAWAVYNQYGKIHNAEVE